MTAEVKLRTLAAADATLQTYFGKPVFRWFDRQLRQGDIQNGACVRVLRVSTIRFYTQEGINPLSQPRFQIDVLDLDSERARAAAKAIIDFLGTIDLASDAQFGSPVTTPKQFPAFILNQRAGMDYQLVPPAYVETLDVRIYNKEN